MKRPPLVPLMMLVVAATYLALIARHAADHLTGGYAILMFLLTAGNLWIEHHDRH